LTYNRTADVLVAATLGRGAWIIQNASQNFSTAPSIIPSGGSLVVKTPVIGAQGQPAPAPPVPIDPNLIATEFVGNTFVSATVAITAAFVPGQDVLGFTDQNGITGSYNATTGALTLSGLASVADYQTALRSVTYANSSENPSEETRIVRFQVTDSSGANSVPSSRQIFISRVNDAPVVTPSDGVTGYTEGDPATAVDLALTVGDVDDTNIEGGQVSISDGFEPGDELLYTDQNGISGSYNSGTGELALTDTASVANYQAAVRSIEFRGTSDPPPVTKTILFGVNDGELDSPPATKTISVTAVNDKPALVASGGSQSFTEGDSPVNVDTGISAATWTQRTSWEPRRGSARASRRVTPSLSRHRTGSPASTTPAPASSRSRARLRWPTTRRRCARSPTRTARTTRRAQPARSPSRSTTAAPRTT